MKIHNLCFVVLCTVVSSGFAYNADTFLPDERNTIEVFEKSSPKVVCINRLSKARFKKKHVPDGAGSGVIWDNKGHIVTNFHVIKGADELSVTVGSMTVPAKVIGKEPRMDIAVLEVKSPQALAYLKNFQPFQIVSVKDLVVGQKAIAIGNPYGLDHSLSKGVISALGRKVPGAGGVTIHNMIQTDTPINPGNSGGPLLNSAGQLIGLNSMIFSPSGTSAGIGFAVPADNIDRIVAQLIQHGRVILPGIGIRQVETGLAARLGVKKGILIAKILPNTPAAHEKLRPTHRDKTGHVVLGDVIVALNTHPVDDYDVFYKLLTELKIGEKVVVSIQRDNKQMDVTMNTIDIAALT